MWVTTHNALPAIWWYANDDAPAFEVALESDPGGCGALELGETLRRAGATRALVYLGFGHHVPPAFDDVLVARLGSLGRVAGYNRFGENSHALAVDLRDAATGPITLGELGSPGHPSVGAAAGCINVSPASRW